jgi:hypothetical protein
MISFLKKVDEEGAEQKSKFMGKSDIIFLLVVGSLVGGFWYFSKSAKEGTYVHFTRCDSLYAAQNMRDAESCYEAGIDLGYRSDSLDSIGYLRRETLENLRDNEKNQSHALDSLLRVGDSAGAWKIKAALPKVYFLEGEPLKQWESLKAPQPTAAISVAPEPSSK